MNQKRDYLINIASQSLAFLINFIVGFFITSYIVIRISEAAYGFVGLANDFIGYAQVLTLALNSMAGRFITVELHRNDLERANRYFTSVVIANAAISLVLLLGFGLIIANMHSLLEIPPDILGDVRLLWAMLFLNFIINILTTIFQVSTFARDKLYLTALVMTGGHLLRLGILVGAYGLFRPSVWYLGLATLASAVFSLFAHIGLTRRLVPELRVSRASFDWKAIRTMLGSGIWNSLTRLGGIMATGLDLLITNKIVGAAAMGLVSISKTLPNMILQFMGMVGSIFAPKLTKSFAQEGFADMTQQTLFSMRLLGIFSALPMAFLFVFGQDFFALWMPTLDAALLHRLSVLACLAYVFSMPMEGVWNVFTAANKVRVTSIYLFLNSLLSIGIVLALLPLVTDTNTKLFIIVGVSSVFSVIRALIFLPLYAAKCLHARWHTLYPPMLRNTAYAALLSALAFGVRHLYVPTGWVALFATAAGLCIVGLPLGMLMLMNREEQQGFLAMIRKRFSHAKDS